LDIFSSLISSKPRCGSHADFLDRHTCILPMKDFEILTDGTCTCVRLMIIISKFIISAISYWFWPSFFVCYFCYFRLISINDRGEIICLNNIQIKNKNSNHIQDSTQIAWMIVVYSETDWKTWSIEVYEQ
jgi:hypothetical protein